MGPAAQSNPHLPLPTHQTLHLTRRILHSLAAEKIESMIRFSGDICILGTRNKENFAQKTRATFVDERQNNVTSQKQHMSKNLAAWLWL